MAIAHVQENFGFVTVGTVVPIGLSATASGNLITIQTQTQNAIRTVVSIVDNLGSTYTQVPGYFASNADGTTNSCVDLWYLQNCPSGVTSFLVTFSGTTSAQVVIDEWSGASTSAALVAGSSVSQTAVPVSPSLTPSASGSLLVSTCCGALLAATGVNAPFIGYNPNFETAQACFAYLLNPSLTATQAVWIPTTACPYSSGIALFQPPVVGPSSKQKASMNLVF